MCVLAKKSPLWQKEHSAVKEMDNCSGHCFSAHYKSKPRGSSVWPFCAVCGCVYSVLCHLCVASIPLHTIPLTTQHHPGSTRAAEEELSSQMDKIINNPLQLLLCLVALVEVECPCWELLWAAVSQLRQSSACCCCDITYCQKNGHIEKGWCLQREEDQLEGKTNVGWALISQQILSASNWTSLGRENRYQWFPPHAFPTWHEQWDLATPENCVPYGQWLLEDRVFCAGHNILVSLANHHSLDAAWHLWEMCIY